MIALIDIGGTSIKYGMIDSYTEEYEQLGIIDTNVYEPNFSMENRLDEVLQKILTYNKISGIAISTAGIVDNESGTIIYANKNIPNYKGTKLKEILENKYKVPVTIENDVNAALLGELNFGHFQDIHSAIMLTIGTGLGGALYLNGRIYHGFSHSAGEVGYAIINDRNIEDIASTTALVHNVKSRLNRKDINGRWIFDQAINQNNEICIEEINRMITSLVYLISNYVALLNPEVVILGGGVMEQTEYLRPLINKKFREINSNELVVGNTKIEFASLGNQAGLLGAYSHYKNKILSK